MDKYLQFDHIELSEDPSFIQWVKGSPSKDGEDWDQWLKDHPEMSKKVDKATSIVQAIKFKMDLPSQENEDKIWSKIEKDIRANSQPGKPKTIKLQWLAYAAAAMLLLVLIVRNLESGFDTQIEVPYAKIEQVNLPDGSMVSINAGSTLSYNKETWQESRLLELKGEAFFEVKPGSTFTVHTPNGQVQVLGTSFNVYARNNQLNVLCETGKVSVKSDRQETILTPNQSVSVVNNQHQVIESVDINDKRSNWKTGVFVFKAAPLIEVVEELERQFDLVIRVDKQHENVLYSGSFNRTDKEKALMEVFYPLNLSFELDGKKVQVVQ